MADMALGPPPGEAAAAVVFMHGRGQSPALLRQPIRRLALDGVHCVAPEAAGNTWYPQSFLAPLADNQPALSAALARYEGIVADLLAAGLPPARIVLAGFSQGACLTAEYLVRHPRRYGGVILWTGGLIGPRGTQWATHVGLRDVPALLTSGEDDAFVPPWRVRETAAHLSACGALVDLRMATAKPHDIAESDMAAGAALVAKVAA
jgi:phospholipase/carboxylesterase